LLFVPLDLLGLEDLFGDLLFEVGLLAILGILWPQLPAEVKSFL
jgi:hypothetical protein